MRETDDDLRTLQRLLDESFESSGRHMQNIITPERRLNAEEVSERLDGMRLLALATSTRDGRPIVSPVDGVFYRGSFWFGSAPDSLRFRHIRERPAVSATHVPEEALAVTVHGAASIVDLQEDQYAELREVFVGIYGPEWDEWDTEEATYARIEARRMFTFYLSAEARAALEAGETA